MMSGTAKTPLPLGAVRTDDGEVIVPESRRADGSVRKPIRIRQGYVPQEEVPKYKPIGQRLREQESKQRSSARAAGSEAERTGATDAAATTAVVMKQLDSLSLSSTTESKPSTSQDRAQKEDDQRPRRRHDHRRLPPPAAPSSAPSASSSSADVAHPLPTSSSTRELKTELSTINKSLREIAKLELFAAAAERNDEGARPLTVAQNRKLQRKLELTSKREQLIQQLNEEDPQPTRRTATPPAKAAKAEAATAKPTTLRIIEM